MKQEEVFQKGSKTYYNATKFFPKEKRKDITIFYGFVRYVDDLVDAIPPKKKEFEAIKKEYTTNKPKHPILKDFMNLEKKYGFEKKWIKAFFTSMGNDLKKKKYQTLEQTKKYIYGSAEVIGLCMAVILNLPEESQEYAKKLGAAMQLINMIRDIHEDNQLGRQYLPIKEMKEYGLESLTLKEEYKQLKKFISFQIQRYFIWQEEAEKGFKFIPKKYRVPIKTASDMYKWTAKEIEKHPLLVFEKKIKPSKLQVILTGLKNIVIA